MIPLDRLPDEVTLQILQELSPKEAMFLVSELESMPCRGRACQNLLVQTLKRVFSGSTIVYCDSDYVVNTGVRSLGYGYSSNFDAAVELQDFQKLLTSVDPREREIMFRKTRPKSLTFNFTRQSGDYTTFIRALREFIEYIGSSRLPRVCDYLESVHQVNIYIDANFDQVDQPSTIAILILKILALLAEPKNRFRGKIQNLLIRNSDIGDYFQPQWMQLFERLENLQTLDLSENCVRLKTLNDGLQLSADATWPPRLRRLRLDSNFIQTIDDLVSTLPPLLEEFLIRGGSISNVEGSSSDFMLSRFLPNLRKLDISDNRSLVFVNQRILEIETSENSEPLTKLRLEELDVSGCHLDAHNLEKLKVVAMREGVKIFY